jgi:diguanylate cyclase (GGDEF)-like protein
MGMDEALLSLAGLSIGDAFGQSLYYPDAGQAIMSRTLPPAPWRWTDDTQMALSVVDELRQHGWIDQDTLARRMAWRYSTDPMRGYGSRSRQALERISHGEYFRSVAHSVDSYGAGSAARAAPIGGFFAANPARASREARLAAGVTHTHPEAIAAAEAVAAAAALAADHKHSHGAAFLQAVLSYTSESELSRLLSSLVSVPANNPAAAFAVLETIDRTSVMYVVPYALWCASHYLNNFEEALWNTVAGLGVRDVTCAIVGGIVSLSARKLPEEWGRRRESLPHGFDILTSKGTSQLSQSLIWPAPQAAETLPATALSLDLATSGLQIDPLTGRPNMLGLVEWVDHWLSADSFTPFSLIAIHLVSLKAIIQNDHTAGDELLRWCSNTLGAHTRGEIFRIAVDKFVIAIDALHKTEISTTAAAMGTAINLPGLQFPRLAVIHFPQKLDTSSGEVLACLSMAFSNLRYRSSDSLPREFEALELRGHENFPWMVQDLIEQIKIIGKTASELEHITLIDSITQLPNMRAAMISLDTLSNQARHHRQQMTVLLIDGDNLRDYNKISFESGDEAIRLLGETLKNQLRETDFLARWRTGDEFIILLPNTGMEMGVHIAERLRVAVQTASRAWLFPTTVSTGLALYPDDGETTQLIIKAAEKGLEEAKSNGKNRYARSERPE